MMVANVASPQNLPQGQEIQSVDTVVVPPEMNCIPEENIHHPERKRLMQINLPTQIKEGVPQNNNGFYCAEKTKLPQNLKIKR